MPIKVKFDWNKTEHDIFEEIEQVVARNVLWTYKDFNEEFKMHTDSSDFQLGAFMIQNGKSIDLYSRKLTDSQIRYTVTKKESAKQRWNFKRV